MNRTDRLIIYTFFLFSFISCIKEKLIVTTIDTKEVIIDSLGRTEEQGIVNNYYSDDFSLRIPIADKKRVNELIINGVIFGDGDEPSVIVGFEKWNSEVVVLYQAPLGCINKTGFFSTIIPLVSDEYEYLYIKLVIPNSVSFYLDSIRLSPYDYLSKENSDNVLFQAHLGFEAFAPENTVSAFELAGLCGFRACITTPIESKDGFIMCYHENNKSLSKDGGRTYISLSANDFSCLTKEELMDYDAGISRGAFWRGERIPTVDEFLERCAKYGMAPTFSCHPNLTKAGWLHIRDLLDKYNLRDKVMFKSYSPYCTDGKYGNFIELYKIFGDSATYVLDATYLTESHCDIMSTFPLGRANRGVEGNAKYTADKVFEYASKYKYVVSAYSVGNDGFRIRRLIDLGVNQFTTSCFIRLEDWMDNKTF